MLKAGTALAPLLKSNVYGPAGSSCGIALFHTMETFVLGALPVWPLISQK
ncbi:hypothetical protein JVU11DRAFT_4414 [Chiua virens]|nr:hypothetical protein JVU11DRAFT_4414 [Chiua virens]